MSSLKDLDLNPASYVEVSKPPLPEDSYRVVCIGAERKFNSKGTGELIYLQFIIKAPEKYAEGKLGAWLNVVHPKPFVVRKGLEALDQFARATGLPGIPADTLKLVGRECVVDTKLGVPSEQYPNPRLDIFAYRPLPVEMKDDDLGTIPF